MLSIPVFQLYQVDMKLKDLKEMVIQKCRFVRKNYSSSFLVTEVKFVWRFVTVSTSGVLSIEV